MITSRKRKLKNLKVECSPDSQADKENAGPSAFTKKKQVLTKNRGEANEKKTDCEEDKNLLDNASKHKKHPVKLSPERVVEITESEEEVSEKPSAQRMSLRKKSEYEANESASKASINESKKEQSESIKTPTSSELPKGNYGLRRRGRGRKKFKLTPMKEEELNRLDDSEFKLPNEEKSKLS